MQVIRERKPGERQDLILQVLRERGHPMPGRSIWHQLRTKGVQITIKNVEQCLYKLTESGAVVRQGAPRSFVYGLPSSSEEPMHTNGVDQPAVPAPVESTLSDEEIRTLTTAGWSRNQIVAKLGGRRAEALARMREVLGDESMKRIPEAPPIPLTPSTPCALRVGPYTINAAAWTVADDHGTWIEVLTTALEIDQNTRHPRTKKLKFEQADEIRRVRAWLAQQTGEPYIPDTAAIERDRDAALALAEAAERRATDAEQRAERAEKQLASIKAAIGA